MSRWVTNPSPSITSVGSGHVFAREAALTITVSGSNFVLGADVRLGGKLLETNFLSSKMLQARIPDGDPSVADVGSVEVDVRNPDGKTSPERVALIVDAAPPPEIDRVSYDCDDPLAGAIGLVGKHFTTDATVTVDGNAMKIAYRSGSSISGTVSGLTSFLFNITVTVPTPGGGSASMGVRDMCDWDY